MVVVTKVSTSGHELRHGARALPIYWEHDFAYSHQNDCKRYKRYKRYKRLQMITNDCKRLRLQMGPAAKDSGTWHWSWGDMHVCRICVCVVILGQPGHTCTRGIGVWYCDRVRHRPAALANDTMARRFVSVPSGAAVLPASHGSVNWWRTRHATSYRCTSRCALATGV